MDQIDLDAQLRLFERYPTQEETEANNRRVLYKRKKHFLFEIKDKFDIIGSILIVLVYLKDVSGLRLIGRGFIQFMLRDPYPGDFYTDDAKKTISKTILISILGVNAFCCVIHLIYGAFTESPAGGPYMYGSVTIQFMGERLPFGRSELLLYDVLIVFVQLVLHNLKCYMDTAAVLERVDPEVEEGPSLSTDGYNGKIRMFDMDLVPELKEVMGYDYSLFQRDLPQLVNPTYPGSFLA